MFDDFGSFLRQLKVFALGKGLLTFAIIAAGTLGAATGWGLMLTAGVAAVGGVALTTVRRFHSQAIYEEKMVDFYRDTIATQLGIAPDQVTRANLREVAPVNPVIAEALTQQRKKTFLTISTAILAGAISVFLLDQFKAAETLSGFATKNLTGMLAPFAKIVGIGTVASLSSLVVHDGLDAVIGYRSGISRATTHDRIVELNQRIKRGKAVSREEVYAVLVANNPVLEKTIREKFGEHYHHMNHAEQSKVLRYLGMGDAMDKLTDDLVQGRVAPAQLADAVPSAPTTVEDTKMPETSPATSFVNRLGIPAPQPSPSHEARLLASRTAIPELSTNTR